MSEEILINGKKITELSDMFFEYCELKKENEKLKEENEQLKKPCLVMPKVNQLAVPIDKYEKLYKALEDLVICVKVLEAFTSPVWLGDIYYRLLNYYNIVFYISKKPVKH